MADIFDIDAQKGRFAQRTAALQRTGSPPHATLPPSDSLLRAESSLPDPSSPDYLAGRPAEETARHIAEDIAPALCGQALSASYYGFVTGGVLPVAEWADNVVSRMDQNVQVHLPGQSASTKVEDAALRMLIRLLGLDGGGEHEWKGRTFTTGATASNVLGLACGREAVIDRRLRDGRGCSVGELGLLRACLAAGVADVQVLTSAGHSSLSKAASVVGLGRGSVRELPLSAAEPWRLDLDAVERELRERPDTATIVAVSLGEVNTGRYALADPAEWRRLRAMADRYGAWIHTDGAFGIFARVLDDTDEFKVLRERAEGVVLSDSITIDGHKLLNVPYDCGMFFTRSAATLQSVFVNPNAAYLSSSAAPDGIASPLNIGLENSRRFRALPAYAVLHSEGLPGVRALVSSAVRLSRRVAAFLRGSEHYELLPAGGDLGDVFMVVLFRARDPEMNRTLVERINATRMMYVSGTKWMGEPAVRMAVSTWRVEVERDFEHVSSILSSLVGAQ